MLQFVLGQCSSPSCQPHVYHFVNDPKTWPDAQKYCRDEFTDLATIDGMEDMKIIIGSVDHNDNGAVWIGLKKNGDKQWHWSLPEREYSKLSTFWNEDEPNDMNGNENCVLMTSTGKWIDITCERQLSSICYDGTVGETLCSFTLRSYPFVLHVHAIHLCPTKGKRQ